MSEISYEPVLSTVESERIDALLRRRPRMSERHRWLYPIAVRGFRARRRIRWLTEATTWAHRRQADDLSYRIKQHKSLLLRQLGESEMHLQYNKVTNLRLAVDRMDGIVIAPGQTFSFNRIVGNCTRRRGYVEGMRLSNGESAAGVGGGICQLANLVHWLILHSDLTVVERSEHSFDPFPDNGRVLPWGTGCSIVYNYVDLQIRNDTDVTYQLRLSVGDRHLKGTLFADAPVPRSYSVYADDERFYRVGEAHFRANDIRRKVIDRNSGNTVDDQLVRHNCALVKYVPRDVEIIEVTTHD